MSSPSPTSPSPKAIGTGWVSGTLSVALASVGLPAGEFKITAVGQTGATTTDGRSKPLRRRADIVLHLSPA